MNNLLFDFSKETECYYENEIYSVRDNGSVMRHSKDNCRKRPLDNKWTFGIVDKNTGYLLIAGIRVHRIVATAFYGPAPTKEHVVDHKNTNKQDNRAENLRWITKLENLILNPITCKKLQYKTKKTIDYILQHIEILHNINLDQDLSWMRSVSKTESENCYNNLLHWALEDNIKPSEKRGHIGEWIYQKRFFAKGNEDNHLIYSKTKTMVHNKYQMTLETEYPSCPKGDNIHSLKEYIKNLTPNSIFCKTNCYESLVTEAVLYKDSIILRTHSSDENDIKPYHVSIITLLNNTFVHEHYKSCFKEISSIKYFTILQGKEWTGGNTLDDYC